MFFSGKSDCPNDVIADAIATNRATQLRLERRNQIIICAFVQEVELFSYLKIDTIGRKVKNTHFVNFIKKRKFTLTLKFYFPIRRRLSVLLKQFISRNCQVFSTLLTL